MLYIFDEVKESTKKKFFDLSSERWFVVTFGNYNNPGRGTIMYNGSFSDFRKELDHYKGNVILEYREYNIEDAGGLVYVYFEQPSDAMEFKLKYA